MSTKKLLTLVFVLLVAAKGLSASLSYSPSSPRTGETVTFTLNPSSPPVGSITWDFGDGSPGQSGTSLTVTHVYAAAGSFVAKATYGVIQSAIPVTDQATVQVTNPRQISFAPPQPKAGQAVMFSAQNYFSSCIHWEFGDGTVKNGTTSESHTYANAGTYTIRAYEECGTAYGASVTVNVASQGITPPTQPTLAVTFVNLYFAGGKAEVSVAKDFTPLQAFADIQVTGAGLLQWQWLVDGLVVKSDTMTVSFGNKYTLDSGKVPGLPTSVPGDHRVTMRFVPQPAASFAIPAISYFVAVKGPAPMVRKVTPDRLAPGSQYKLDLEGTDLTPGTEISFPAPLAVVKKAVILSPTRAQVIVFVAPTARMGARAVMARNEYGQTNGPGQVMIAVVPRIGGQFDCYPDATPPYVDVLVQLTLGENPDVQAVTGAVVKVDGMDVPEQSPTSLNYQARLNMDLPVGHQFTVSVTVNGITYIGKGGQIDNFFRWAQPTGGQRIDTSKPSIDCQWTFENGVAPVYFRVEYHDPLVTPGYTLFQTDVTSDHYAFPISLIPSSSYPYSLSLYLTKTYAPIIFEGVNPSRAKIPVFQGFLQRQSSLSGGPIIVKPFPFSAAEFVKILGEAKKGKEPTPAQAGAPVPGSIMQMTRPSITGWIDCFPSRVPPSADVWTNVTVNSIWVPNPVVTVDGHVIPPDGGPAEANAQGLDFSPGHRFSVSVSVNGFAYTGTSTPIDTVAILDHPRDGDTISLSQKKWLGIGWSFNGAHVPIRLGVKYCSEGIPSSCFMLFDLQMVNGNGLTLSLAQVPRGQGGRIIIFFGRDLGPIVWDRPDILSPDSVLSVGQSWNFAAVVLKVVD